MATSLKGIRHTEDNAQDKDYYDLPTNVNNKGFLYEEYIFELLKDQNLVPAGSGSRTELCLPSATTTARHDTSTPIRSSFPPPDISLTPINLSYSHT